MRTAVTTPAEEIAAALATEISKELHRLGCELCPLHLETRMGDVVHVGGRILVDGSVELLNSLKQGGADSDCIQLGRITPVMLSGLAKDMAASIAEKTIKPRFFLLEVPRAVEACGIGSTNEISVRLVRMWDVANSRFLTQFNTLFEALD